MPAETLYRVHQGRAYILGIYLTGPQVGRPVAWTGSRWAAATYTRSEAEQVAQLLADYLASYPTAGESVARTVRVSPATGGSATGWRPTVSH